MNTSPRAKLPFERKTTYLPSEDSDGARIVGLEAGGVQRRFEQELVSIVEIDFERLIVLRGLSRCIDTRPFRNFLFAKGHNHEHTTAHCRDSRFH